jgi:hypothetical protein
MCLARLVARGMLTRKQVGAGALGGAVVERVAPAMACPHKAWGCWRCMARAHVLQTRGSLAFPSVFCSSK